MQYHVVAELYPRAVAEGASKFVSKKFDDRAEATRAYHAAAQNRAVRRVERYADSSTLGALIEALLALPEECRDWPVAVVDVVADFSAVITSESVTVDHENREIFLLDR